MEGGNARPDEEHCEYRSNWQVMSPEIVEIGEGNKTVSISSRDCGMNDVYVAVGKNDLDVVKWALDHAMISPGARVFLVHVFPPITYISTPVGRLSRSQLTPEQVRFYVNEENNRRRNVLQKYIQLCAEAKVTVDTMLLESNSTAKAILDLIPVLNITYLVMGTKRPPASRRLIKGLGNGEFVQKKAPDYCEVAIVYDGKKLMDSQNVVPSAIASNQRRRPEIITRPEPERNFFDCICFSAKSD
ncbi:U-box domain-containing protein 52-like [Rhododendron vialii]|uniref:U-box domain-containing protein 52-like n=1 Tax=Rhododendron vialii TaxID=182163 RepID=UPI00265EE28D|nr:U-box domain-containing protein 52-like [Rhododendron vialii]